MSMGVPWMGIVGEYLDNARVARFPNKQFQLTGWVNGDTRREEESEH